jgi:hypothetical protein
MARTETDAALFGISYLGVADLFSKSNSSPQTTELNAKKRAPTLMKWVNIGSIESIFLVGVLSLTAVPGHRRWPLFGGLLSLVITYGQYVYAKACGIMSDEPGTEDYGTTQPAGRMR